MSETALPPPPSAISRPVSEALLNEKVTRMRRGEISRDLNYLVLTDTSCQWDRCLSNLLVKSTLGLGFGVIFSVLVFKRRAWPAFAGVGFGAGRAYEECNFNLKQAARDLKKHKA